MTLIQDLELFARPLSLPVLGVETLRSDWTAAALVVIQSQRQRLD